MVIVFGHWDSPKLRTYAECGVHAVRRPRHLDAFDAVVRAEGRSAAAEHKDTVDQFRSFLVMQIEVVPEIEPLRQIGARRGALHGHKAVRLRVPERLRSEE